MTNIITAFPKGATKPKANKFSDLVPLCPDVLPWPMNVWARDDMGRYGCQVGTLMFSTDWVQPTPEMRHYFNTLVAPLGVAGTVIADGAPRHWYPVMIYNNGVMNIDRATLRPNIPQSAVFPPALLSEFVEAQFRSVTQLPYAVVINATGSIAAEGLSCNDLDLCAGKEIIDPATGEITGFEALPYGVTFPILKSYFTHLMGWKVDVGAKVMNWRKPKPKFLRIYDENGTLCLA